MIFVPFSSTEALDVLNEISVEGIDADDLSFNCVRGTQGFFAMAGN